MPQTTSHSVAPPVSPAPPRAVDASADVSDRGGAHSLRVLLVAEHASPTWGGEARIPLHYFRSLLRRGLPCWLLVHERTRDDLRAALSPEEFARIEFVPDSLLQKIIWRAGRVFPDRVQTFTSSWAVHLLTQRKQRVAARRLVRQHAINLVHEPIPVSPRLPSMMYGVGAPVVIGPMNGGMSFPPGFALDRRAQRFFVTAGRAVAGLMNRLMPGKRRAALLLVANQRTRAALPPGLSTNVLEFIENGVDLSQWPAAPRARTPGPETVFAFFGRLVDWKGCDTLLRALARLGADTPARVLILGDGAERANLETLADRLGVRSRVEFAGWLSQSRCAERLSEADVLVLPSVLECGGAVVLEAMAKGLPVIAADWGGPADYLDPSCGVLVTPDSPEHLVAGVAAAMATLARSPELRERMGRAGRAKVESQFSWERRVERMLRVYHAVAGSCPADRPVRSIRLSLPAGLSEPEVAVQGAPVPAA